MKEPIKPKSVIRSVCRAVQAWNLREIFNAFENTLMKIVFPNQKEKLLSTRKNAEV